VRCTSITAPRAAATVMSTVLVSLAAVAAAPTASATVSTPGAISSVVAVPGPAAGQVTFTWAASGASTTAFVIETGLTTFKVGDPVLPDHGRHTTYFTMASNRRSITLSAAQVASAGAGTSSANHLYYRFKAVNQTASGTAVRTWPYLQNVAVKPGTPASTGTALRVATFNVRTATAAAGVTPWTSRVAGIARTILSRRPGVVGLQELGIGRADGSTSPSTTTSLTQVRSLLDTLAAQGGGRYQLVRSTRFVAPGTPEAIQGARILYDTSRYQLVSSCPERSDSLPLSNNSWSSSCSVALPMLTGDSSWTRRRATYAVLADRTTGRRFYVVSAHLDQRHSTASTTELSYERLRAAQVRAVLARVDSLNTGHLPVVLAGDLNTYQNNQGGYDAHDTLVSAGFYDTAAAVTQVNPRYTTMNHFACTLTVPGTGWGSRLDVVAVRGVWGASRWENVLATTDCSRPSDHNMVVADIRLP
jgi:endonuclease/exonuclease/phosphatase family metal-dependent hydrolase